MRGHREWPGIITQVLNGKFCVYFYGTQEVAIVGARSLYFYCEATIETFGVVGLNKSKKNHQFQSAIDEISEALSQIEI